ncbi:hypothetical protein QEN19_000859 [Hanseniaspora menglaensis]
MFRKAKKETFDEDTSSYIKLNKPIAEIPERLAQIYTPQQRVYTDEEVEKFNSLRAYIDSNTVYPVIEKNAKNFVAENGLESMDLTPLSDIERHWLSDRCLYRYLRACKWVFQDAKVRLVLTIAWRREFGIIKLKDEVVSDEERHGLLGFEDTSIENETGKEVILGYDNDLRPILYLKPGRQNTHPSKKQVQHLVFMLERAIDFMDEDLQDTLTLLIDFKSKFDDVDKVTSKLPHLSVGKEVLYILQTHYPERLGRALLFNMHWIAKGFLNLISPFIDPMTRSKIVYDVKDVEKYVQKEQLDKDYGGLIAFTYEHDEYWPALQEFTERKRSEKYKDIAI